MKMELRWPRGIVLALVLVLPVLALSKLSHAQIAAPLPDHVLTQYGSPPLVPAGAVSEELQGAIRVAFQHSLAQSVWGPEQNGALERITQSKDPRLAWIISDMMRFTWQPELMFLFGKAAAELLDIELETDSHWGEITDHLIAWDIPSYPDYLQDKSFIFTNFGPEWEPLFVKGDIDWRLVSWGGVPIDDRAYDATDAPCDCIPAADNPEVIAAKDAAWLEDGDIVFGVAVNGAYRAYPRRIMEVREMVNDTLGGRHLAIPYCTLCGAAQAYFTDQLPDGVERPVLRTSGLLIRSNKVMYDVNTYSMFDTFLGKAVTGPLGERDLQLQQAAVVTTDWGRWKKAHPETTVLVEALALGRNFDFRNGRDANGPIFPVGDVDPRLPAHEDIIGVVTASGKPVAFQRRTAMIALRQGADITYENVSLQLDAGGVRAVDVSGASLGSHQAFWFAWSQFHPETILWTH